MGKAGMHKDTKKALKDVRSDILDASSMGVKRLDELKAIRAELSRLEKLTATQIQAIIEEQESGSGLPSGEEDRDD